MPDYKTVAGDSLQLRDRLESHYLTHGQYPESLLDLDGLSPAPVANGLLWEGWTYTSFGQSYVIYTYPAKWSRTRLIFQDGIEDDLDVGWFVDDESGDGPVPLNLER